MFVLFLEPIVARVCGNSLQPLGCTTTSVVGLTADLCSCQGDRCNGADAFKNVTSPSKTSTTTTGSGQDNAAANVTANN